MLIYTKDEDENGELIISIESLGVTLTEYGVLMFLADFCLYYQ